MRFFVIKAKSHRKSIASILLMNMHTFVFKRFEFEMSHSCTRESIKSIDLFVAILNKK
jgi:hypothetical protein